MKNYLCIPVIYLFVALVMPTDVNAFKYGLGSCLDQRFAQDIWPSIKNENIDGFIFLGDNVYGDIPSGKLSKMKKAYACLLYTSPSPRDQRGSRMPSSA